MISLAIVLFCALEVGRAWGIPFAALVAGVGLLATLFVPLGWIAVMVAGIALGGWARSARLDQVVAALDADPALDAERRARIVESSDNPFESTDTAPREPPPL